MNVTVRKFERRSAGIAAIIWRKLEHLSERMGELIRKSVVSTIVNGAAIIPKRLGIAHGDGVRTILKRCERNLAVGVKTIQSWRVSNVFGG